MSNHDDGDGDRGFRRQIRETKEEAFQARRILRRGLPDPDAETRLEVATVLSDYRDLLSDYASESALKTPWDERDVDWIDQALSETVPIERELPRRGHQTKTVELPAVAAIDPHELLDLGKELDAIAKELGFAASARDQTENTEASEDDIVHLLTARGQDDALEQLPDSWTEDVGGEPT